MRHSAFGFTLGLATHAALRFMPRLATHALMPCSAFGFTPGLVLLWGRVGMCEDVLRFWMGRHRGEGGADGASAKVVEQLMYGTEQPQPYPLVLQFLTSMPGLLARHPTYSFYFIDSYSI